MNHDITIPPAALEAAAEELFFGQYGDSNGSWADAPEWIKVAIRNEARAACLAMLKAWPAMRNSQHVSFDGQTESAIILPLPQEPTND